MKKRSFLILILIVIILGATAFTVYFTTRRFDTTLEFQIRDTVSKNWVWDSTITLQNRTIRSYFQSDRGPIYHRFTHLQPGDWTLKISAPAYEDTEVPVTLKRGRNRIEEPIEITGLEIPNLDKFIIFEDLVGEDIICEIRPVGTDSRAVINHPCMMLWIGARVSVQMKEGLYVQTPTDEGSERGEELFQGRIEWEWDSLTDTLFRYSARIPGSGIKNHEAPLRVIDYLIIVPNPKKMSFEEIEKIIKEIWNSTDPENLKVSLDTYSEVFKYFIFTSWNVGRAE